MSNKRISKTLIRHKDKEEELTQRFIENEDLLNIIVEALKDKREDSVKEQKKITAYGSPNWGFLQADHNATQRTLTEIIDLLTLKE